MTMLSITNIFLRVSIIFILNSTAFGVRRELRSLLGKSFPIIRKFQDTKTSPEQINFATRGIAVSFRSKKKKNFAN